MTPILGLILAIACPGAALIFLAALLIWPLCRISASMDTRLGLQEWQKGEGE